MKPYYGHIEEETLANTNFRKVVFTGAHSQLVLMHLKPGEEIGEEVHVNVDQFFRFEEGECKVIIDDQEFEAADGDAVVVPAGAKHNIINIGSIDAKLYTIYSPANHPEGTVHKTKAEADEAEKHEHH